MKNVFFRFRRKCKGFCEKLALINFFGNIVIAIILIALIIFWFIFFPSITNIDSFYIPAVETDALIEDDGENWRFILDNSIITYPKNQINPMYEAGQKVDIIVNKAQNEIINFCNYTTDGVIVFDKDGQKVDSASNLGYDKFLQFEEIKKINDKNEEIRNSKGYDFPIDALLNILILGGLVIVNVFISFYSEDEFKRV